MQVGAISSSVLSIVIDMALQKRRIDEDIMLPVSPLKLNIVLAWSIIVWASSSFAALSLPSFSELLESQLQGRGTLSGAHVLEKGEESLLARAWLSEHAVQTIDVQYFIWSTDNIGILAAEFLLRAAERGVRVRVIVDDLLIDAPDKSMLALAAHPNIGIKIYNPKHSVGVSKAERVYNMLTDFRLFNQRMHDKTMIVDGQVAITGGRNMADEYFDYDHAYNFRDRDILLLGPVVKDMENSFSTFWNSSLAVDVSVLLGDDEQLLSKEAIEKEYASLHAYASKPENFAPTVRKALTDLPQQFPALLENIVWDSITFIHDMPGKNSGEHGLGGGGESTRQLIERLSAAQSRVVIESPYLVLPEGGIEFFSDLIAKGVEVRIVTNSLAATDNMHAFAGYAAQREAILEAGIKVFEFKPRPQIRKQLIDRLEALEKNVPIFAIHAKTMVIDGTTLYIGTFNLDPRSANLNTEVGVLIENNELASQVEQAILTDMLPENSWQAGVDDSEADVPFMKRLRIWFLKKLPLEPLL